jgi:hypothetical protein
MTGPAAEPDVVTWAELSAGAPGIDGVVDVALAVG